VKRQLSEHRLLHSTASVKQTHVDMLPSLQTAQKLSAAFQFSLS